MPLQDLDSYLQTRYRQLGLGRDVFSLSQRQPTYQPVPPEELAPATAGFPQFPREQFREQRVEEERGRSWWETLFDVLSAGEFAVANFARSIVQGREARDDPFTAAWKGFRSAFTDEEQYQARMGDVLTDLGWEPQSGVESVAKGAFGFALGALLDPLTYVGIGPAARGTRLSGTVLREAAERAGVTLPKAFLKGQVLNKEGAKVFKALKESRKGLGIAADQKALSDLTRLVLYTDDLVAKDPSGALQLVAKPLGLVDEALTAMGRKVSDESRQWFLKDGYKTLLDKGGLKFFGHTLLAPQNYLTPRAASLHGLLFGNLVKSNAPLVAKLSDKFFATRFGESVKGSFQKLFSKFTRYQGFDETTRGLLTKVDASGELAGEMTGMTAEAALHYGSTKTRKVPTLVGTLELPVEGGKPLTFNERNFLGDALTIARAGGIEGPDALRLFLTKALRNPDDKVYDLAKYWKVDGASDELLNGFVEVGDRVQELMRGVHAWETVNGVGSLAEEAYIPREWLAVKNRGIDDPVSIFSQSPWFWQKEQLSVLDNRQLRAMLKAGDRSMPGVLSSDLREILVSRLGATFRLAHERDALQAVFDAVAKHPAVLNDLKGVLADKAWVTKNPQLARAMADMADATDAIGIPKAVVNEYAKLLRRMVKSVNPEETKTLAKAWLATADALPEGLSVENLNSLQRLYDRAIEEKVELIGRTGMGEDTVKLRESLDAMREVREDVFTSLGAKGVEQTWRRQMGRVVEATGEYAAPDLKISQGAKAYVSKMMRQGTGTPWLTTKTAEEVAASGRVIGDAFNLTPRYRLAVDMEARAAAREIEPMAKGAQETARDFASALQGRAVGQEEDLRRLALRNAEDLDRSIGTANDDFGRLLRDRDAAQTAAERQFTYARMALTQNKLDALITARRALPATKALSSEAPETIATAAKRLQRAAGEKGLSNYVPSILRRYGGTGSDLGSMTAGQLDEITKRIKQSDLPSERMAESLTKPGIDGVEFRAAQLPSKYTIRAPGAPDEVIEASSQLLPAPLARELEKVLLPGSPGSKKRMDGFLWMAHAATNSWKKLQTARLVPLTPIPRPAFFFRNFLDLAFRGSLGFGMRFWTHLPGNAKHIKGILTGAEGVIEAGGVSYTYDYIRQLLKDSALWRRGLERVGVDDKFLNTLAKNIDGGFYHSLRDAKARLAERLDALTPKALKGAGPDRWNSYVENVPVIEGLLVGLAEGRPITNVLDDLRRTFFAFNNLTEFERRYARLILPFYGFTKSSLPFVSWTALKQPWVMGIFPRIRDLSTPPDQDVAELPEWVRDYPWVQVGRKGKNLQIVSMRNVFTVDVLPDLLPAMQTDELRKWFASANPVLTAAPELLLGRDLYFDRSLKEGKVLSKGLESKAFRQFVPWLQPREVTIDGKPYIKVNARAWHATTRLWYGRLFRELDAAASALSGDAPALEGIMGLATGFKLQQLDTERQLGILHSEADQVYSDYRRALRSGDTVRAREILDEYRLK